MRKASVVILNECEGSITVVKKAVGCHPGNRFFTLCHYPAFLPFLHSILTSVLNDDLGEARH